MDVSFTPAPGLPRSPHGLAPATARFDVSTVTEMSHIWLIFSFLFLFWGLALSWCHQLDRPADMFRADTFPSPEAVEPLALPAWMF